MPLTRLYFSGNSGSLPREQRIYKHVKFPHRCLSYAYLGARRNDQSTAFEWFHKLPSPPRIFLDSGAFTLQSDLTVTVTQAKHFAMNYKKFIERWPLLLDHYVSVDWRRDGKISEHMQKWMEGQGMKPVPVFHAETEFFWFEKLVKKYKTVAVSKPDRISPRALDRMYNRMFRIADEAGVQIHGLSETGQNVLRYPFYSADSTSWLQDAGRNCIMFVDTDRKKLRRLSFGAAASSYTWDRLSLPHRNLVTKLCADWGFTLTKLQVDYTERAAFNAMSFLKAIEVNILRGDGSRWTPIV